MALLADLLLLLAAVGAGAYCFVLSKRLARFTNLEGGMGGAVAVLAVQVEDLRKAMDQARGAAAKSADDLEAITSRAEASAQRLELLMASMHDITEQPRSREVKRQRKANREAA